MSEDYHVNGTKKKTLRLVIAFAIVAGSLVSILALQAYMLNTRLVEANAMIEEKDVDIDGMEWAISYAEHEQSLGHKSNHTLPAEINAIYVEDRVLSEGQSTNVRVVIENRQAVDLENAIVKVTYTHPDLNKYLSTDKEELQYEVLPASNNGSVPTGENTFSITALKFDFAAALNYVTVSLYVDGELVDSQNVWITMQNST